MASLNLATLSVEVQATGINETERSINNLTGTIQNTQGSTNSFANSFNGLGANIRNTVGQTQLFGTSLSSIGSAFTSASGMATLMQGAVIGLTTALVQMATQAIQKAIAGLGDFVKKGIQLASDLQEVQNVVETTFGKEGSDRINEWAATCSEAFGMNTLQMLEMSGQFGSILNGMDITGEQAETMSQQIVQLAGDIASFNNLDVSVAFEKLRAGILGESEPIKSLGIIINETTMNAYAMAQGFEKTYSQMTENEKVLLRFNYILEKTSNAQGDFAKTSESFSNSQKLLKNTIDDLGASFAEGFLEQLGQFGSSIREVLSNLKPVVELIGNLVGGALQTLMNLLKPFIDTLNLILMILKPIVEFINKIVEAVKDGVKMITDSIGSVVSLFSEKMGIVQKKTGEAVEYTTQEIKEQTDDALGYVTTATDKWVKAQMDNWKKQNEDRYADTLAGMIRFEKDYEAYEQRIQNKANKSADNYIANEKSKNATLEERLKLLDELETKYSKTGNVASWTGNAYATGTNYHTGGLAMVGELGRELVELPRGARVYTNRQTENMLNSGGGGSSIQNTNYISINASDVKEFNDIIAICNGNKQQYRMGVI